MLPMDARSRAPLAWSIACIPACTQASAAEPVIEEVVVTALKRSTLLQETPMSMLAVTGETIKDRGIALSTPPRTIGVNFTKRF